MANFTKDALIKQNEPDLVNINFKLYIEIESGNCISKLVISIISKKCEQLTHIKTCYNGKTMLGKCPVFQKKMYEGNVSDKQLK